MLRVHLTFDIEVWCPGWSRLDDTFPAAFERYVWGRSKAGDYALPRNLQILQRHGLQAVFFVEPLFSLRFGRDRLHTIVDLISTAGQDVQLHLHPEWVDEITPPLLGNVDHKRQYLTDYSLPEQLILLGQGKRLVEEAKSGPVTAFRSGGYAANRQTYAALGEVGIRHDSSLNATYDHAAGSLGDPEQWQGRRDIDSVQVHPVSVFRDGRGRLRHLQVGACSFLEMRQVLDQAHQDGLRELVFVSHNFEMLKPGGSQPDRIVERRFDKLCAYLSHHRDRFDVRGFDDEAAHESGPALPLPRLHAGRLATGVRLGEQALRRVF
jgi:hypothetical protein